MHAITRPMIDVGNRRTLYLTGRVAFSVYCRGGCSTSSDHRSLLDLHSWLRSQNSIAFHRVLFGGILRLKRPRKQKTRISRTLLLRVIPATVGYCSCLMVSYSIYCRRGCSSSVARRPWHSGVFVSSVLIYHSSEV